MTKVMTMTKIIESLPYELSECTTEQAPWTTLVEEDFHIAIFKDGFPVSYGHLLFVPKYNTVDVLADAVADAIAQGQRMVAEGNCDGYNIGINVGEAAGQTVAWPHVHMIPRRTGDVTDPRGGVRNVIPHLGNYKSKGIGDAYDEVNKWYGDFGDARD
jgi:diadenosine tetraphosphate (Ap4A) HIT family hydrolase